VAGSTGSAPAALAGKARIDKTLRRPFVTPEKELTAGRVPGSNHGMKKAHSGSEARPVLYLLLFAPGALLATPTPTPMPSEARPEPSLTGNAAAPDSVELTKLLRDFLAGASRNDVATHDSFWADELIYTSSNGRRIGKSDIMREVREGGPPKPGDDETVFSAEDIRIQQYGSTAIVAFRLVGTTRKKDKTEVTNYLNTGTLLKRNGKWQAVSWQSTKMRAE
jgi:hypothetical protein